MADDGSQQHKPDFRTAVQDAKALATVLVMEAESILGRRTARVLGVLVLFAVVVGILHWYIAPSGAEQKQALVVTLAQILAGTALLSGIYFTWRTLQVNREGQITERFTRAIDQLGSKELEIRLGGIYALERIARDSERDHWPIMEVLTAYVRQHAPWQPEEAQHGEEDAAVENSGEDSREATETTEVPPPGPDIQAIMTVLRRRTRFFGDGEPEPLDLHSTHLREASLTGAILQQANLYRADLQQADLLGAILQQADLREANLLGAILQQADLREANLIGAILLQADLEGANLIGAVLLQADLREANLHGANLQGAYLHGANLHGAEVTDEQLADTRSLQGATMPDGTKHP